MGPRAIREKLSGLADIRAGEIQRLLPLVLTYGLTLSSVYVLKPARNALFLDRVGIGELPYVMILVALVGGITASLYARFSGAVRIDRLIRWTFLVLISNLLIFRFALPSAPDWAFYLFYVWVKLYGLVSVSLLWLLANATFNAREARRLFGFIGSGGIAGSIVGGLFTSWAVSRVGGTENLLFVCAGILGLCVFLVRKPELGEARDDVRQKVGEGPLKLISGVDLLRLIAVVGALAVVIEAVVDVQFNQIADEAFPTKDAKTAFFGGFYALLNVFTFLFQLLVIPRILRTAGVGRALMFLPFALAAGSLGTLLIPGLIGGIAVKVGDIGFRHSIHKSATEILYLPVPAWIKKRTKVFLDTTVDNVATGVGAVLVLILTGIGVPYRSLAFLTLGLVVIWLALLSRVRRAYVDGFRRALERREIDLGETGVNVSEAAAVLALTSALDSRNERQVIYALDILTTTRPGNLMEPVEPLISHLSAEVRRKALQVLVQGSNGKIVSQVEGLLEDDDPEVRLEAVRYLCRHGEGDPLDRARGYLGPSEPKLQAAALGFIATYGTRDEKDLVDGTVIQSVLEQTGEASAFSRMQAARAIGGLDNTDLYPFLDSFMADPSPMVVSEAIRSVGQIADLGRVLWLLEKLADRQYRVAARDALAAMGPAVLDVLVEHLDDDRTDPRVRRAIPRVLNEIRVQESVNILLARLDRMPLPLVYPLIKALNKLRVNTPALAFDPKRVDAALFREARSYYEVFQIRHLLGLAGDEPCARLLSRALGEKQDQYLEHIFRLLALGHPPDDIYHAYLGIVSKRKALRASAVEFLDNVLDRDQKACLLPFLDPASDEAALEAGRRLFDRVFWSKDEALTHLIKGDDPWLRACAIGCIGGTGSPEVMELVRQSTDDPDPVVAETAAWVLRRAVA